jgi:hypothetical protein
MTTKEEPAPLSSEVRRLESEVGPHAHYPLMHFRVFEQLKQRNVFRVQSAQRNVNEWAFDTQLRPPLSPGSLAQTAAIDPERSDDSPHSCRSRVMKQTLTAPPVDPDRLLLGPQPRSAKLSHLG